MAEANPEPAPVESVEQKAELNTRDVNLSPIVMLGVTSSVFILVIVVALQAWFYDWQDQLHHERVVSVPSAELERTVADEQIRLGTYDWVDREEGTVRVPIGVAIELYAQQQQTNRDEAPAP